MKSDVEIGGLKLNWLTWRMFGAKWSFKPVLICRRQVDSSIYSPADPLELFLQRATRLCCPPCRRRCWVRTPGRGAGTSWLAGPGSYGYEGGRGIWPGMPEKELTPPLPPSYLPAMQFPSAFSAFPGSLHPGKLLFFRGFLVSFTRIL